MREREAGRMREREAGQRQVRGRVVHHVCVLAREAQAWSGGRRRSMLFISMNTNNSMNEYKEEYE